MDLLNFIIVESEKAANIARLCRQDGHLFGLLVQEKDESEANPRFVRDFKTLADVLIQEMIRHDFQQKLRYSGDWIRGEESNEFSNKLGETITVRIGACWEETSRLLQVVLNGDKRAADLLAMEVHKDVPIGHVNTKMPMGDVQLAKDRCRIWIDPIDSTAEYISGVERKNSNGINVSGLRCVTVLIGVYDEETGLPAMGVVNQPFFDEVDGTWSGQCFWGVRTAEMAAASCPLVPPTCGDGGGGVVCVSGSERPELMRRLKALGFTLVEAAGAGYKLLMVITGYADAYLLSQDSTFKWDTCGPHAILRALGGRVLSHRDLAAGLLTDITYNGENKCNVGGIFAYRGAELFEKIRGLS